MQMQKTVSQILEGNFNYESGSLDFSCEKIELSIRKGEQYEGTFRIHATPGVFTDGTVHSSDWRVECLTQEFTGTEEEILFRVHGERLEEGDVVKGVFDVVSNQGEYYLPFVVNVEYRMPESSIGSIKNLFHFANLAKSNWREAVKLFYSPEFARIFSGSDARYAEEYRAFSACAGREQNVEEFLILVNKKQRVEYLVEETELFLELEEYDPAGAVRESGLLITRNGWGFTQLSVECKGDFLFTEKGILTDDDFLGNRCRLPVYVDGTLCRRGKNFGRICLYNSYVRIELPVTVRFGRGSIWHNQELAGKGDRVHLMELYQAFRLRKIGTSTWLRETGKLVERLVAMDEEDISARLFQAQLLITEERYNEAGWILDHVSDLFEKRSPEDSLLAYYLYLTTLIHGEEEYVNKVAEDVEHIFRKNNTNWRVAWLLLYLSEDYRRSDTSKWTFLETVFSRGCTSPVLYIEAVFLVNANPSLLRKLGEFEIQVLYYGVRQGVLKREAAEQAAYLAGRRKEYSQVLFRILERLYEKRKEPWLLQEVCALLIKGGKVGKPYFEWYKAGVDSQLRITNLYEYYCRSLNLDRNQDIPKAVLKYFSYQNNMDYAHMAYLYDYVLQRRDRLGDIYEAYKYKMEYFVTEQIRKGHIDRHLANLYNKFLRPGIVDSQTGDALSRLLFAHLIQVEDAGLKKVYVYQPGNRYPDEYILSEGRTWAAIYGSRYTIVFEDDAGNLFLKNVEYTMEKLMMPGRFLKLLLPVAVRNPGFDLWLCEGESAYREEPEERIKRELRIVASDYADSRIKRELYLRILQYYYDMEDMRALDEFLKTIPAEALNWEERGTVVKFMILRGNYELAWQWVETYGPYFVDVKLLVRLLGAMTEKRDGKEDMLMTAAAVYVFHRGKADSVLLEYLLRNYRGMTRNMRDIWKAARAFDMDCTAFSERLLVQMLYSRAYVGEKMEIFHYYISCRPKDGVEEAFLIQCAHDCFVGERVMESEVFREMHRMYAEGKPMQKVCKLAFLKYFSENHQEIDEETGNIINELMEEMLTEGIHLSFFRKLGECREMQRELADKTMIEYRTGSRARVCIHYSILRENGAADGYRSEYMREVYGGVFCKEFILFFGESLQYYITEENEGEEKVTESGTLQKSDDGGRDEDSRYRLINDIAVAKSLQDCDTMDDLLEEYYRKDYLGGRLFALK